MKGSSCTVPGYMGARLFSEVPMTHSGRERSISLTVADPINGASAEIEMGHQEVGGLIGWLNTVKSWMDENPDSHADTYDDIEPTPLERHLKKTGER